MKKYIGTKVILAKQGTEAEAQALKCNCPVEVQESIFKKSGTVNRDGYIVKYSDDYISWSPKEQFERAYRAVDGSMSFGHALELLKMGFKVARKGWNGKAMFIYIQPGSNPFFHDLKSDVQKQLINSNCVDASGKIVINPHIDMKAADGTLVVGWLASQTDMLAEDWVVVE